MVGHRDINASREEAGRADGGPSGGSAWRGLNYTHSGDEPLRGLEGGAEGALDRKEHGGRCILATFDLPGLEALAYALRDGPGEALGPYVCIIGDQTFSLEPKLR